MLLSSIRDSDTVMNILVTYFSHTGNTAGVAHQIAMRSGADEEPVLKYDQRTGIMGKVTGAIGALMGRPSSVTEPEKEPTFYDLVLIGTPVWAAAAPPAINAWIDAHREGCKRVAFFATSGGFGENLTFSRMEKRLGKAPIARLAVAEQHLGNADIDEKIDSFISEIKLEK